MTSLKRVQGNFCRAVVGTMQKNPIDILYSRPGMYLAPYEKVDAASFIVNFLIAVFEN